MPKVKIKANVYEIELLAYKKSI